MEDSSNDPTVKGMDLKQDSVRTAPPRESMPHAEVIPQICCHEMDEDGRNVLLCVDGTSNQFGKKNTNVIELYNLVLKDEADRQKTWYNSGIGTYARKSWKSPRYYKKVIFHKVDLAIAWDFERTVLAAYRWLSDVYKKGDRIFLFGFSRGAFQVRVLSAMIEKVGLIHKGNEMQIPFAYELYEDVDSHIAPDGEISSAQRFKSAFSRKDVKVHFVGAWDTVSSIGIARGTQMLPGTTDGMGHVCFFRHALALDERRVKFLPEFAYGGSTMPPPPKQATTLSRWKFWLPGRQAGTHNKESETKEHLNSTLPNATKISETKPPHTLEVWFAGTHSDIGGGNVQNAGMDRSRPPLRWMVLEARALGLRTAEFKQELKPNEHIHVKESLTWVWWFLEILPLKRLTYTRNEQGTSTTRKPHLGSPRKIHPGQKIHSSLWLAGQSFGNRRYTPKARPFENGPAFWDMHEEELIQWLELDLFEHVNTLVSDFIKNIRVETEESALGSLQQIALGAVGQQAVCESLYKGLIGALGNAEYGFEKRLKLLALVTPILQKGSSDVKVSYSPQINALVLPLLAASDMTAVQQKLAKEFLHRSTNSCMFVLHGHTSAVASVALSPDGKLIVSGSYDKTIRMWNSLTGAQVREPLHGHTNYVRSVAFSPDGKRIVSGSDDRTIRLWDSATGEQIGAPFEGHTGYVLSVTFSPDGTRVVSGSHKKTVRIWDCETGKQIDEPLAGHTDWVRSVTFSPDGMRIVSGSDDKTIRLWDLQTAAQFGQPFTGHTWPIVSVVFSPDGKHIVSGSLDNTIRVWDAGTGKQVGEPFQGHTHWVNSVAFSPDGRRVVSGSRDKTVRIWDVGTGKLVGDPLRGHTDSVWSVAFSPDGKRVVSGSDDRTVRVWDVEMYMDAD